MKAVFLDADSLGADDLDLQPLKSSVDQWQSFAATAPEQVIERIDGADIIIVNKVVLDAEALHSNLDLKLVCVAATGTNNVDLQTASALGVVVCNCQAYGTASVAQHVFALMLALSTRLLQYHQAVQAGDWTRSSQFCLLDYPITELSGKTLGIVGYGELGQEVARLAQAFGMQVLVAERAGKSARAGRMTLEALLPQVDVLSLHCPLTDETRGLIGSAELALMRPGALLINAARGGIVDEPALVTALEQGQISGAGVDVLSVEPPPAGNPLLCCRHPNLIITPHSAWGSREARQRIVGQVGENIRGYRQGRALRMVN